MLMVFPLHVSWTLKFAVSERVQHLIYIWVRRYHLITYKWGGWVFRQSIDNGSIIYPKLIEKKLLSRLSTIHALYSNFDSFETWISKKPSQWQSQKITWLVEKNRIIILAITCLAHCQPQITASNNWERISKLIMEKNYVFRILIESACVRFIMK